MIPALLGAAFLFFASPGAPPQPNTTDPVELARAARLKGDFATARRLYELALRQDPQNGPVALALAETLSDLGDSRAAEDLLVRLVRSLPERPEPRRALVLAHLRNGKASEALAEAQKAVELDPQNAEGHFCLGSALRAAGRPADAIPEFEKAAFGPAPDARAMRGLALAYVSVDDPRAQEAFERALAVAPEDRGARLEFAMYLWQAGNFERGNEEMDRVLKAAPGNAKLRAQYAANLIDQGRFARGAQELRKAWKDGARDYDVACSLGAVLAETGRFEEAAGRLREAILLSPDKLPAHHILGLLLLLQQKPGEASAELERAAALAPGSAGIQLELGRAYEAVRKLDKAEASYRKALKIDPTLAKAHYTLGTLLARTGRREEADEHIGIYRVAFQKEQDAAFLGGSRRAELNLAWIELQRGRPERALEQYERHPDNADALRGAARALIQLGRDAEAVQRYERAVALAPEDAGLRYELDRAYDRARKK